VDAESTREHIEAVSARIRAAAPDDLRERLLRAAAVHEDRDRVPPDVADIVLGFGEVWRVNGRAEVASYVERHAKHLRALLLFELAHEGAATDAMRAAADEGGFRDEFAGWELAVSDDPVGGAGELRH
jgi:hypothetical protein